uniref:Uncharacterized protein n=1 Tax=Haptolina brevifila TaxID=156173 RepID=A0A7S2N8K6_9EUKA|mmetsp:Transcript_69716/g.138216  ORF Transcript_69716/g.138216 Transcript_69716/m.138216 type:complete len:124 (+) Transcript_69716:36-407(+)
MSDDKIVIEDRGYQGLSHLVPGQGLWRRRVVQERVAAAGDGQTSNSRFPQRTRSKHSSRRDQPISNAAYLDALSVQTSYRAQLQAMQQPKIYRRPLELADRPPPNTLIPDLKNGAWQFQYYGM